MDRCFKYCVLRLMPDPVRGEVVNIGLIVFVDDRIDLRIGKNLAKAQALVPNFSLEGLAEMQDELGDIAADLSPEEAITFLKHYGPFTVSDIGFMTASEATYEAKIDQLMRWLVSPPAKASAREGRSRLATEIRSELKRHKILASTVEDIYQNKIVAGYELPGDDDLSVDFAIKNGLYRFTQVIDYRTTPKGVHNKIKEVSLKAIAIHQAPGRSTSNVTTSKVTRWSGFPRIQRYRQPAPQGLIGLYPGNPALRQPERPKPLLGSGLQLDAPRGAADLNPQPR